MIEKSRRLDYTTAVPAARVTRYHSGNIAEVVIGGNVTSVNRKELIELRDLLTTVVEEWSE